MSLNYASLLHVLSQPFPLFNSPRLDRRLDNDLITSARRADVSLLARPTHACTCYCKFPGNQGRGQPVWSWAAATIFTFKNRKLLILHTAPPLFDVPARGTP